MILYRITTKYFVAGCVCDHHGRIIRSAPILRKFCTIEDIRERYGRYPTTSIERL